MRARVMSLGKGGGLHPGPVMTRGGALAIRLVPKRKMINFEQTTTS